MRAHRGGLRGWIYTWSALVFFLGLQLPVETDAQTHRYLFRQRAATTQPGPNATLAHEGDIDESIMSVVPDQISIELPGRSGILAERRHHELRTAKNMVWRGRLQSDAKSKVTLTFHDGVLIGHIQTGNETFVIRPGRRGRSKVEKINPASFAPEWGHDRASRGKEMVPPLSSAPTNQESTSGSTTAPVVAAAEVVEITLMSVYTPQARAGAAAQNLTIQAQIQAAVDQANTAFINSNMIARYKLVHTAEVAYNDTGNISNDLSWVTGNATVASLRNTHAADMVSLITENGGGYCGVGWVQRNPGAGFANYAFQVTARNCLPNNTFAHEHGHNLGMEHDPGNSGTTPSGASYPWSFAHFVSGSFRTIMSYSNSCTSSCPRILHYSNPDVFHDGVPTGIPDQRDNAHTGDLIAPIVANFRNGTPTTNSPPAFINDPIARPNGSQGVAYTQTLAGSASDPNNDPLTYAKTAGPSWLTVAANGALGGTPGSTNVGANSFTVSVSDGKGGVDTAILQINVVAAPTTNAPPVFAGNPITKPNATQGAAYSSSLAGNASDSNNDLLTFAKSAGPTWLTVATTGALSGTPGSANLGLNSFTVTVSDGKGGSASTTLQVTVVAPTSTSLPAPSNLSATSTTLRRIDLSWQDNATGESGFRIERSRDGVNFTQVATVGTGVTGYSDLNRRSGRRYHYRVRAYNTTTNSAYSNIANVVAR